MRADKIDSAVRLTPPGVSGKRYSFSGHALVLHDVSLEEGLQRVLRQFDHQRAFVVCSRSLNTRTEVIRRVERCLGSRMVGLTDEVGEHSPLPNALKAATAARDADADVMVAVGGGSVMDLCKVMQLCISESVYTREALLALELSVAADAFELTSPARSAARIRQIALPTTLATSEWTPVSTPIDPETRLKPRFLVPDGAPEAIVYDPDLLTHTPLSLLLSTGIRGLDHAINSMCSTQPHPLASILAEQAVRLYVRGLPRLADADRRQAAAECQLATWYTGMGQMSVPHGFSHWMVHILGPIAGVPHSDAACVLMLAQARWLDGWARDEHRRLMAALGQPDRPLHAMLEELLQRLGMPTTLDDLGVRREQIDAMIAPALSHPMVTRYNKRPIATGADLRAILELAWRS
jgi:maleylacetate reductase